MKKTNCLAVLFLFFCSNFSFSQKNISDTIPTNILSGIKFRSVGPAFTSGRIADFAVNPNNISEYYVAVASGNIWKTTNSGTTFKPVFDNYGSYSIGCLAMDPKNPNIVWAGTGENNHQRALGYGDGIYKTEDGGQTWNNLGLKDSRHIGMITIHPDSSNVVYVAAEGSAWGSGGDRGLYKTVNGGKDWIKVLEISENTGINNVLMDPRYPNIVYATSEQRRRHAFTKIGGGPESAVYKSTDYGVTFKKIMKGLPQVNIGGMGIALSPVDPDILYLIVEAAVDENRKNQSGFFRSTDRGESWQRMSDHASSGQYYNEIYCDPVDVDRVYSVETFTHYTEDGGKTFKRLNNENRHVDDHALWINPTNTNHFIIGSDGGIYETFDQGKTFVHKSNLPIVQFYRVALDNDFPFYNIYGGTQDNNTIGTPSQTLKEDGITSDDCIVTLGGDGFWPGIDPENPDIVYSEYQYGNIYRFDKKSGDLLYIKPMPEKGENTFRWNWNTPFIISPHSNERLYIAANYVFRSDDRGNSWTKISGDLTTQIDRNSWTVMDHYWSIDAVVKDVSTSLFNTIIAIDESTVKENLLYIGTDDGLIQVTEDAKNWRKINKFPDVPEFTYVSDIKASMHDENIVFASFDNRKRDDFKPYLLKSEDKGKSWKSIVSNLPKNGTVFTIEQDHINPDLLFVGTEFGVFCSHNGGGSWVQLKSGMPTISVKDIEIQRRENDLVCATFGRGFYVLDDYSVLRELDQKILEKPAYIFPVKDALIYNKKSARYGQGHTYFKADNPPFGAIFTYYLRETPKTMRQARHEKEKELFENKEKIPQPKRDVMRSEELEDDPYLLFTVKDKERTVIRRIKVPAKEGINRVNWDLRFPYVGSVKLDKDIKPDQKEYYSGFFTMPGDYTVSLDLVHQADVVPMVENITFKTVLLDNQTLPAKDLEALGDYQNEIMNLAKKINGTFEYTNEIKEKLEYLKKGIIESENKSASLLNEVYALESRLDGLIFELHGTTPKASPEEVPPEPVSIASRLEYLMSRQWSSTAAITGTEKRQLSILNEEFPPLLTNIKEIGVKIKEIEKQLEELNAPWTKGRVPEL